MTLWGKEMALILSKYSLFPEVKTNSNKIYGKELLRERHRHRYEYTKDNPNKMTEPGLIPTGVNPKTGLVEIIEIPTHKSFIGVQYHPEYKSTVSQPHPLFVAFVKAALNHKKKNKGVSMAQS